MLGFIIFGFTCFCMGDILDRIINGDVLGI